MSPRGLEDDLLYQASAELEAPERFAVALFYNDELVCVCNGRHPNREHADRAAAEKRRALPTHTVKVFRAVTTWEAA
jgi:hypothetical protein